MGRCCRRTRGLRTGSLERASACRTPTSLRSTTRWRTLRTAAPGAPPASTDVPLGSVIVTGGSSGLGQAVALAVRDAGGTPVVVDLDPPANGLAFEEVDLSDTRAAEAAVQRVAGERCDLTGVVTAAGTDACGKLDEIE